MADLDSNALSLSEAVSEIHQACAEAAQPPERSPFFFVVGAGISHPPVPLAAEIIEHCQDVAQAYKRDIGLPEGGVLEALKLCSELVPDRLHELRPEDRKEVLDAASITGQALLSDPASLKGEVLEMLARVLSVDPELAATVAPLPPGRVVITGSRRGRFGFERSVDGTPRGNFSVSLEQTLLAPGARTLREAVLLATESMLQSSATAQTAAIAGDAAAISLFAAKKPALSRRPYGKVRAVLVGVGDYAEKLVTLSGPPLDVASWKAMLRNQRLLARGTSIASLTDKAATLKEIRAAMAKTAESAQPDDLLFLYFSGLGYWDERAGSPPTLMIAAHDARRSLDRGVIRASDLIEPWRKSRAKHAVALFDF